MLLTIVEKFLLESDTTFEASNGSRKTHMIEMNRHFREYISILLLKIAIEYVIDINWADHDCKIIVITYIINYTSFEISWRYSWSYRRGRRGI